MTSLAQHRARMVLERLKNQQEKMLELLEKLVINESPSSDAFSQIGVLDVLAKELEKLQFHTIRVPGKTTGGYLYARPRLRNKKKALQLLVGHGDTVWEKGTLRHMPIIQQNGQMRGPGIYDMKAGLTQLIFALKTIKELDIELPLTPVVLINTDEEIGSRESTGVIKRLARICDRAYVMEPPLGHSGKLKTGRKGIGRFTVTVKGKAAHAGLDPEKGASAIVELSHQVQSLYAMNDFDKGITVNVGMIQGGISPNVVAPESSAVVDVRVLRKEDGDRITKKIYGLKPHTEDVELHIEGAMGRPAMERTSRNQLLWKLAKEQGSLLGLQLEEATAGGGSDGNTTSLYTATLDGLGTTGDGAHARHEFIYVNELPIRTALLALLLISGGSENR